MATLSAGRRIRHTSLVVHTCFSKVRGEKRVEKGGPRAVANDKIQSYGGVEP